MSVFPLQLRDTVILCKDDDLFSLRGVWCAVEGAEILLPEADDAVFDVRVAVEVSLRDAGFASNRVEGNGGSRQQELLYGPFHPHSRFRGAVLGVILEAGSVARSVSGHGVSPPRRTPAPTCRLGDAFSRPLA